MSDQMRLDGDLSALAHDLETMDVAGESLVREGLARVLRERGPRLVPVPGRMHRIRWRRLGIVTALAATFLIAVMAATNPGAVAAIAQEISRILTELRIGPHTALVQDSDIPVQTMEEVVAAYQVRLESGEDWNLATPYGGTGGHVPEGGEPYSRYFEALGPLARAASFDLLVPTVWPKDLPSVLRFGHGWLNPDGSVYLMFCLKGYEFFISQTPVTGDGRVSRVVYGSSAGSKVVQSAPVDAEPHEWDGVAVYWSAHSEGLHRHFQYAREITSDGPTYGLLLWEKDGVSYALDGQNMTLAWAEEIWRSLRPWPEIENTWMK